MGEYANRNGEQVKLGTCEDLYYVTRGDIEQLAAGGWEGDGGMKDLRGYLVVKQCRVRLPDFSEDVGCKYTIGKRDMDKRPEYPIRLDPDYVSALAEIDHNRLTFNRAGVNFFVECPLGKNRDKSQHSGIGGRVQVVLTGEGLGLDTRRAIYRCPFCNTQFNLRGHPLQMAAVEAFKEQWMRNTGGLNADGRLDYMLELIQCGQEAGAAA